MGTLQAVKTPSVRSRAYNLPPRLMNVALISFIIAGVCATAAYLGRDILPVPILVVLWHTAATSLVVATASWSEELAPKTTFLFGKLDSGHLPWRWWLLFWPFHAIANAIMLAYRVAATEPLVSEIEEGWYLGGCPTRISQLPPGPAPALLDCTCEMPLRVAVPHYKLLKCWETHGLVPDKLQEGVEWALLHKSQGHPVYVYCTHGHGRSAVVLCALLIANGLAGTPEEAWSKVMHARPGVHPNTRQRVALDCWFNRYGSSKSASSNQSTGSGKESTGHSKVE